MAHERDRCLVLSQSWCQRRPQQQERSEPVPAKISGGHVAGWEWRKGSVVSGVTTICGAHLDHSNPKKYVQLPVYCDAYRDTKRSRAQQKKRCSTNPGQLFNSPYFAVLSAIPKDPERSTSGIANPMFKSSYFTILCAAGGDPKLSKRDAIDPPFGEAECADLSYFTKVGATCDFFRNLLQTHRGVAEHRILRGLVTAPG